MATKQPVKKAAKTPEKKTSVVRDDAKKFVRRGVGFVNFIRTQGIIGLAVGLAVGAAAGDTVKKLVEGFINPVVQFLVGTNTLTDAVWTLHLWGRTADFKWGAFVSSFITLLATAFVVYLIIHGLRLDRLDKQKDA